MNYRKRLDKLQNYLKSIKCDALIIDDPTNLYYLTGMDLSAGKLLVHTQGAKLFVDNRYLEVCRNHCPFPVDLIDSLAFEKQLAASEFSFISTLGFDADNTTYKNFQQMEKLVKGITEHRNNHSKVTLVPLEATLLLQRSIKDAEEIELLRYAGELGAQGFDYVCTLLKEGISEQEIATELEIFWKKRGGRKVAFDPIIAFGANSSMPHYRAGNAKLQKGDIVLVDIGVNLNHYHSDMTRMAFFGKPDPKLLEVHEVVKQAQQAAMTLCRPGIALKLVDAAARDCIESKGGSKLIHSLGHGIGLDIHEYPFIRNVAPMADVVLEAGMVITIEPGIYLPGLGGVRIEDTLVITSEGCENLTNRSTNPVLI